MLSIRAKTLIGDLFGYGLIDANQSAELINVLTTNGTRIREAKQYTRSLEDVYFEIMHRHEPAE